MICNEAGRFGFSPTMGAQDGFVHISAVERAGRAQVIVASGKPGISAGDVQIRIARSASSSTSAPPRWAALQD
ncbi:MAG: cold-shock protein [Mesorhizobium sp.]|nr:MAG: cold-shock protein [Mesorhizobium sp.]TIP28109.1 MAG: cold-shock protein [Mesorhizobium sp.]